MARTRLSVREAHDRLMQAKRDRDRSAADCPHWDYEDEMPNGNLDCCRNLFDAEMRVARAREQYWEAREEEEA